MRRAALLLAAVLLLGSARSEPGPKPDPVIAACEAATAFAEWELARRDGKPVFSTDGVGMGIPPGPAPDSFDRFDWGDPATGKSAPPPQRTLLVALHALDGQSAVTGCASLRAMLDARHIGYGEQAVARAQEEGRAVISLSLPAASESEAVLGLANEMGPYNSSADLYLLRRDAAGKWRVVGFSPLWIS